MNDATSLMPPSPGLSAILLSSKLYVPSPKEPENVNITTLNRKAGNRRFRK